MTLRTTVAVYVCTYNRNELLAQCISSIQAAAQVAEDIADVGLVVVDDNADGGAEAVVDAVQDAFPLGLHYVHVGQGNISLARNAGLEAASRRAAWVAMTDDDCQPDERWIVELIAAQRDGDYDAVTGPIRLTAPADGPRWLREQPFFEVDDAAESTSEIGYTNNSMIRSAFLLANPNIRFDPSLGVIGGEDMVFYHQARDAGLRIGYTSKAVVRSIDDPVRTDYRHQLRYYLWLGNTEATTNRRLGRASATRLVGRGAKRLLQALARPVRRLAARKSPQLRYAVALCASAMGMIVGALGVAQDHPR